MQLDWRIGSLVARIRNPERERASREAAQWHVRLESESCSPQHREDFARWLVGHSENRRAFERLERMSLQLDRLLKSYGSIGAADARASAVVGHSPRVVPHRRSLFLRVGSLAAAAAAVVAAIFLNDAWLPYVERDPNLHVTKRGEQRLLDLADGSRVRLNTDTRIRVSYTPKVRQIELLRGEAYFAVAKNRARRFLVRAGENLLEATGTEFAVRKDDRRVLVTVVEGSVRVSPGSGVGVDGPAGTDWQLEGGEAIDIGAQGNPVPVKLDNIEHAMAWQRGNLVFEGTSIGEIIAEVNRYSDRKVILMDDALAQTRMSGVFRTGNIDGILSVLEEDYGAHRLQGPGLVILY